MKGIEMYAKIQELKELGMSQNAVAAQLGINRATVRHYWNMSTDEYSKYSCSIRRISILDQYKSIIAGWILVAVELAEACQFQQTPFGFGVLRRADDNEKLRRFDRALDDLTEVAAGL